MKKIIFTICLISLLSIANSQSNGVCSISSLNTQTHYVLDQKADKNGNFYEGGYYNLPNYETKYNFFVRKYNPNHQLLWEKKIPMQFYNRASYCSSIDVDTNGNLYCGGSFLGDNFILDTFNYQFQHYNSYPFVTKFDSSGNMQWIVRRDTSDYSSYQSTGVTSIKIVGKSLFFSVKQLSDGMYFNNTHFKNTLTKTLVIFKCDLNGNYEDHYIVNTRGGYSHIISEQGFQGYSALKFQYSPKIEKINDEKFILTGLYRDNIIAEDYIFTGIYPSNNYLMDRFYFQFDTLISLDTAFINYTSLNKNLNNMMVYMKDEDYFVFQNINGSSERPYFDSLTQVGPSNGSIMFKYDKNNAYQWSNNLENVNILSLHNNKYDEVILIGKYDSQITLESNNINDTTISAPSYESLIYASYDKNGDLNWVQTITAGSDVEYISSWLVDCNKLNIKFYASGVISSTGNNIITNSSPNDLLLVYQNENDCSCSIVKKLNITKLKKTVQNCNISSINIEWEKSNVNYIDIYYSTNNGQSYNSIVSNHSTANDVYSWTNPNINSEDILVKIVESWNNSISSIKQLNCKTLNGNYTIGGTSPDYIDIRSAVRDLEKYGICNDVTFLIRDGNYNNGFNINPYKGMSDYTLSFIGESHDSTQVIISSYESYNRGYFFIANNVKNIKFRYLKFLRNNSINDESEIQFNSNFNNYTSNIEFSNCIYSSDANISYDGDSLKFHNNLVQKPNISGTYGGGILVLIIGDRNFYSEINDNTFINTGIQTIGTKSKFDIYNNKLLNSFASFSSKNVNVYKNSFNSNLNSHVFSNGPCNLKFYNNMIVGYEAITYEQSINKLEFINNSIYTNTTDYLFTYYQKPDSLIFKNNIFYSPNTPSVFEFRDSANHIESDYNNYIIGSTLYEINYNTYNSISDAQNNLGLDMNSISINPNYTSNTDLHANSSAMEDMGTPISYITHDFDDEIRSPFTPDIGADEYSTASINDFDNSLLKVIPNPSTGIYKISDLSMKNEVLKYEVYNLNGELLFKSEFTNNTQIDLSKNANGIYLLKLHSNKDVFTKRLIKLD